MERGGQCLRTLRGGKKIGEEGEEHGGGWPLCGDAGGFPRGFIPADELERETTTHTHTQNERKRTKTMRDRV